MSVLIRNTFRINEHNGWVPRDFWLEPWEKEAIVSFHLKNPLEGYRRLTLMMLDADIVGVGPASVWRVLKEEGLLSRWKAKSSRKGTGFEQPPQPHQHRHIDVSYINLSGTFYYLCSVLDGYSRFLVHWDLPKSMSEADSEVILERAREFPRGKATHHFGQRATVHRPRFQGIRSNLRHDACANFTVLSPIERKNRALAQVTKGRVHLSWNTAFAE